MIFSGTLLWLVALAAVLLWIPQNAQHEGMHAFIAKRYGAEIVKMVLYPTDADDKLSFTFWKEGHTWAYVQWTGGNFDDKARAVTSCIPQVTNTLVLFLLGGVRFLIDPSPVVVSLLAGWALVNFIDGAWNLGTFYRPEPEEERKSTDGWSFQKHSGLDKWLCRGLSACWHLGFGALLFLAW